MNNSVLQKTANYLQRLGRNGQLFLMGKTSDLLGVCVEFFYVAWGMQTPAEREGQVAHWQDFTEPWV